MCENDCCAVSFAWIFSFSLFFGPLLIQDIYYLSSREDVFWELFEPTAKFYFQSEFYLLILVFILASISIILFVGEFKANCFSISLNCGIALLSIYLCVIYILIMISGGRISDSESQYFFESFMYIFSEYEVLKIRRTLGLNQPNSTYIKRAVADLVEINQIEPFLLRIIMISFTYIGYVGLLLFPIFACCDDTD